MSGREAFGLSAETVSKINSVFSRHAGVEEAVLYGSRAKGNFKPGSDIDLALVAPSLGPKDVWKIEGELDDLMLPYQMDLCLFHEIDNPNLLDHIKRVGRTFYRSG
jgi:predicted nucleotidyltransferase